MPDSPTPRTPADVVELKVSNERAGLIRKNIREGYGVTGEAVRELLDDRTSLLAALDAALAKLAEAERRSEWAMFVASLLSFGEFDLYVDADRGSYFYKSGNPMDWQPKGIEIPCELDLDDFPIETPELRTALEAARAAKEGTDV